MRYVKKVANHVWPTLEVRLYTLDALYVLLLMCPVNSQNKEKLAYYAVSPAHGRWLAGQGEACLLLLIVYWFIGPHYILFLILTID